MIQDILLRKEVFKIDFRPNIKSASKYLDVAAPLETDYDDWVQQDNNTYLLYSESNLTALRLNMSSIVLISEGNQDLSITSPSKEKAFEIFNKYKEIFGIEKIHRVGFGSISIYSTEASFNELTEQVYNQLYTDKKEVLNVISDSAPKDVAFTVNGNKNGFTNHIEIGPTHKLESIQRFRSSFLPIKVLEKQIADVTLFTNTDVFIEGPSLQDINEELIGKLIAENQRIEKSYIAILKEDND